MYPYPRLDYRMAEESLETTIRLEFLVACVPHGLSSQPASNLLDRQGFHEAALATYSKYIHGRTDMKNLMDILCLY